MIPTMILFGLAFGRWWRSALVVGSLAWPIVLLVTNVINVEWALLGAAVLALINVGAGVLVHQAGLKLIHRCRQEPTPVANC
jgi:hypothetical protein